MRNEKTLPCSSRWAEFDNVERVSSDLCAKDVEFFQALGRLLIDRNQIGRFSVTLLHSHFNVANDEFLGEVIQPCGKKIETRVYHQSMAQKKFPQLVPRSWSIKEGRVHPLTYIDRSQLKQQPLEDVDAELIEQIVAIYDRFDVSDRFGLAHPGIQQESGIAWVESECVGERRLSQDRVSLEQINKADVLNTMWVFDDVGKHVIALGCCYRDKNGHQWRHASGRC